MALGHGQARAARLEHHRLLVGPLGHERAPGRRGAHPGVQDAQQPLAARHAAEVGAADLDHRRRAVRGRGHVQVGPQGVRLVRRPGLPARHHPRRLRPGPGQEEQHQPGQPVSAERERGGDAEVAAATAPAGPEQVAVAGRAAAADRAVGRDDLHRLQRVTGQPVGPGQHPGPAAEGEAGHPHRRARAARHGQAMRGEPVVQVDQVQAGADPDRLPLPDLERVHRGHVHHEPGRAGPPRVAVPAGPGRDGQPELADEGQAGTHVAGAGAVRDAGWLLPVEPRVEEFLRGRVDPHPRADQLVRGQRTAERLPVPGPRAGLGRRAPRVTAAEYPGQRDGARRHPGQRQDAAPVRPGLRILARPAAFRGPVALPGTPALPAPLVVAGPKVSPRRGAEARLVMLRPGFAAHGCPQFPRHVHPRRAPAGATRAPDTYTDAKYHALVVSSHGAPAGLRRGKEFDLLNQSGLCLTYSTIERLRGRRRESPGGGRRHRDRVSAQRG